MAKKIFTKRKTRAKIEKPAVPECTELNGWKIGDIVWVVTIGGTKPSQLEIKQFHPDDSKEPAISGYDISRSRYCAVAMSWCANTKIEAKQLYSARNVEDDKK